MARGGDVWWPKGWEPPPLRGLSEPASEPSLLFRYTTKKQHDSVGGATRGVGVAFLLRVDSVFRRTKAE